jgi:hypothetical protein
MSTYDFVSALIEGENYVVTAAFICISILLFRFWGIEWGNYFYAESLQ